MLKASLRERIDIELVKVLIINVLKKIVGLKMKIANEHQSIRYSSITNN